VLELLTAAYSIHSSFCEARVIKTVTHCRPTLINHLPKIKYGDGLIAINGLYRHGYLIAPSLMADVMLWIQQGIQKVRYPQLWEKYR
jgi:glycine oxidase